MEPSLDKERAVTISPVPNSMSFKTGINVEK
jgi:hypothetical protein